MIELSIIKAQETANSERTEAKRMLCSAIGLPENIGSETINRAVDCIINTALLEALIVMRQGFREN